MICHLMPKCMQHKTHLTNRHFPEKNSSVIFLPFQFIFANPLLQFFLQKGLVGKAQGILLRVDVGIILRTGHLPTQLAFVPLLLVGFNLIKTSFCWIINAHQYQIMTPRQDKRRSIIALHGKCGFPNHWCGFFSQRGFVLHEAYTLISPCVRFPNKVFCLVPSHRR